MFPVDFEVQKSSKVDIMTKEVFFKSVLKRSMGANFW